MTETETDYDAAADAARADYIQESLRDEVAFLKSDNARLRCQVANLEDDLRDLTEPGWNNDHMG